MPNLHYWNSLLVLLLFLTLSPKTNLENVPNQELIDTTKSLVQKIKSIQKHCKEHHVDLKTLLSKEEQKEYQATLAFIKKYLPEIKADAFSSKQESENETEPLDEDISQPAFIEAVLQWRTAFLKELKTIQTKYAEVVLDPNKFSTSIGSNLSVLPLNTALYEEWKNIVAKIPNPSTGAIVFDALIQNTSETWMLTQNIKKLTSHYRKAAHKKIYSKYEETRIDGSLPQIALFQTAIDDSKDPKDPNLPENTNAKAEADKAKAEADKAKAEAYRNVLNTWVDREVANLSYESGDDTIYVDMTMISIVAPSMKIHNLPIELQSNLLQSILTNAKKLGSRKQSVKNLKNIAIGEVTTFHTQNLHKKENYQDLTLEKIEAIKFPTNISGWILDYQVSSKERNPKVKEYQTILENWRQSERTSLDSTNASEHLKIDPVSLKLSSNLVSHTGIPDQIRNDFLEAIKAELVQVEKQEGVLNFNKAATTARNQIQAFARDYNIDNTLFDYKALEIEEIRKLEFPSGLHGWLKDAEAQGVKKDVKTNINAQLKLVLKNDIKFNLEALVKELKIDMGGLTINNDFNFDNDMTLTYNSLSLILKELIEINKSKKIDKKPKYKAASETVKLVLKDFYNNYYNGCDYGGRLMLKANLEKDSNGTCTFSLHKNIAVEKGNGSILVLDETLLEEIPSIKIKKNKEATVKIDFALTYRYNKESSISITKEGAYIIKEAEGSAGIEVGSRFAQLYLGARYNVTKVPEKESVAIIEASKDKTFTDSFTFEIVVKNTENGIEFSRGADISFADANYNRLAPQLKEIVKLCGDIETKYTAQSE
ncbi:MAG: Unknown protein [uncultured Aureispira sp.]|uniref:Uncharacterized protein n=1 Tax=uncultured Aureispira sp. TaxID=1331704 RepID=A0A6S6U8I2_9BACT|nr:MAG: Unknown protein [uncultured Aureispira sp.]